MKRRPKNIHICENADQLISEMTVVYYSEHQATTTFVKLNFIAVLIAIQILSYFAN